MAMIVAVEREMLDRAMFEKPSKAGRSQSAMAFSVDLRWKS
jgi:hypothetical protein